jgi:Cellulase (glycosyl hydrolase family 5)
VRGQRALGARLLALGLAVCGLTAVGAAVGTSRSTAYGVGLQTSVNVYPTAADGALTFGRVHAAGASMVRLVLSWRGAAPTNPSPRFDPANPEDPAYRWHEFDRLIDLAVAYGLTPIVDILGAPQWAQSPPGGGELSPDPSQLALFAHAVATRYDGSRAGVPPVRYWEVWNEPNISYFLQPQLEGGRVVSVDRYRAMVNGFADAVHGVSASDVVIGGALAPNGVLRPEVTAIAPLQFTREVFCLSPGQKPHRTCSTPVDVDAWSVHPYTSGGPSTVPANPDNVWLANLGSMTALIHAAQRLGALRSTHPAQVWVSEFSWDSNPPDPAGVPLRLEQRWVAEALYRSWRAGVNVFTWFALRDQPLASSPFQSGLYFGCPGGLACDTPKPAEAAFRFPFVAYTYPGHRATVWGRTPAGLRVPVQIQWRFQGRWRKLAILRTDGDGIFSARLPLPRDAASKSTVLRATLIGGDSSSSPSFSLHKPPDILVTPFGS